MSKDFTFLRHWITGEGYSPDCPARPVILECIRSRSGMSLTVYDRGERIYAINGCGFDRLGCVLAEFLETLFQPELQAARVSQLYGAKLIGNKPEVYLEGARGFESMRDIAQAIGLKVHQSESKAGTLIIIEKV